jgi:hypothetical protein
MLRLFLGSDTSCCDLQRHGLPENFQREEPTLAGRRYALIRGSCLEEYECAYFAAFPNPLSCGEWQTLKLNGALGREDPQSSGRQEHTPDVPPIGGCNAYHQHLDCRQLSHIVTDDW